MEGTDSEIISQKKVKYKLLMHMCRALLHKAPQHGTYIIPTRSSHLLQEFHPIYTDVFIHLTSLS